MKPHADCAESSYCKYADNSAETICCLALISETLDVDRCKGDRDCSKWLPGKQQHSRGHHDMLLSAAPKRHCATLYSMANRANGVANDREMRCREHSSQENTGAKKGQRKGMGLVD